MNWRSYFVYSTNAGVIWNPAASRFMRGGSRGFKLGLFGNQRQRCCLAQRCNAVPVWYRGSTGTRGTGNAANSQCALSVELE